MGMFDKDKEIGLIITRYVQPGEEFILWGVRILREDYPTDLGPAVQSELTVSKVSSPGERYATTTLAQAIAAKVREADPGDFPAICSLAHVPTKWGQDALVIQFLKPYGRPDTSATQTQD